MKRILLSTFICLVKSVLLAPAACAADTDGDGLLDVIDVPGFVPNARGSIDFRDRRIFDLDGVDQLTHAQSLSLWGNRIRNIERGDFNGLSNLEILFLDHNIIANIESGAFDGLTGLQYLGLGHNQIANIESRAFEGLTSLHDLWLDTNQIMSIQSDVFAGLTELQYLSLYRNQIESIESGAFSGLSNLLNLSLYGNQITSIESDHFAGLNNLQVLGLSGNQITSIESDVFAGLNNLTGLGLSSNQITSIESDLFAGLSNLQSLDLSNNPISSIESGAFQGLTNLRRLIVSGTHIDELNLAGATFDQLTGCHHCDEDVGDLPGLEVYGGSVVRLILDDARLSADSFESIVYESYLISDVSLVGLTFSGEKPADLTNLLGISTLDSVTVDPALFALYANEFNAFAAIDGNTLTIVPEPASIGLLLSSMLGIVVRRRSLRGVSYNS